MVGANLSPVDRTSMNDFSLIENDFFDLSAASRSPIFETAFSSRGGDRKWSYDSILKSL